MVTIKLKSDNVLKEKYKRYQTVPRMGDMLIVDGLNYRVYEVWLTEKNQTEDYAAEVYIEELP